MTEEISRGILHRFWRALGPGLVTGAADDDPSGIATYSQAGAQFGFALTWTLVLTLPFMAAIQIISAVVGWETRQGLARNLAKNLPAPVLLFLVALLIIANTINIAADLAAMGEALKLVIGGPQVFYALVFGAICLVLEVAIPYHAYAGLLKFIALVLLVYVAAAFSVHVAWGEVLRATVLPQVSLDRDLVLTIVAVFGTTISPYLFFWQASQEAEESRLSHRVKHAKLAGASEPHEKKPRATKDDTAKARHRRFRHIATDTWIGMFFSNCVAFFIVVTTAATLHATGATNVATAAQAAEALKPVAGNFAFFLFALGIIGTGLLAVPVLAGSAAYAAAETFGLRGSLELPASRALGFYAIVGAATLGGAALTATNIDAIAMLFWSAVINGIAAVPIMFAMMWLVTRGSGAHALALPRWIRVLGWLSALLMAVAVALLLWLSVSG
jgi:NRAMP (natural resistance-associated macrophage protein)-like metal ion transporter